MSPDNFRGARVLGEVELPDGFEPKSAATGPKNGRTVPMMRCAYCGRDKAWQDGFPNRIYAECWECVWRHHQEEAHPPKKKRWWSR